MKKSVLFLLVFTQTVLGFAQKDTVWLSASAHGFYVEDKKDAEYYLLPAEVNGDEQIRQFFYVNHTKFIVEKYTKPTDTYNTTYYTPDGSINFTEKTAKGIYSRFYNNGVLAFSRPLPYGNYMKLDKLILYGQQKEPLKDFKDYKIIINYDNGANALYIDVLKNSYQTFYPNGAKASELIKGPYGYTYKRYFENNRLWRESELDFDLNANGPYTEYYYNGNLHKKGMLFCRPSSQIENSYRVDNEYYRVGVWKTFYPNGKLFIEENLRMESYDIEETVDVFEQDYPLTDDDAPMRSITPENEGNNEVKNERKPDTIKVYDIQGKYLVSYPNNKWDLINEAYDKEISKYLLTLIKSKETKALIESELGDKLVEKDNRKYLNGQLFSGTLIRGPWQDGSYTVDDYIDGSEEVSRLFDNGTSMYGVVCQVDYDGKGRPQDYIIYESGDTIESRRFGRHIKIYPKAHLDYNGAERKTKYDIVPIITNYIKHKEEGKAGPLFIPSLWAIYGPKGEPAIFIGNHVGGATKNTYIESILEDDEYRF